MTFRGIRRAIRRLDAIEAGVILETKRALAEGLNEMKNIAIESLSDQSPGRRYGNHIASLPGDAPNTDQGTLAASIFVELGPGLSGKFGSRLDYAKWLEEGVRPRLEKRPFLSPAVRKVLPQIQSNLNERYGVVVRRAR